jgi:hypothetical protein
MATTDTAPAGRGIPGGLLTGIGTPLVMLLLLAMIVLPLPPFALDVLFTFNIALAIIVLLAAVYAGRPLEFAVFPTVLLICHAAAPWAERGVHAGGTAAGAHGYGRCRQRDRGLW